MHSLSESAGLKIFINGEEKNAKGLKNGDKVTIKLEFNESYLKDNNIKIENAEYEVEAEGLKTGTKVDLFKDVDVKFTGNDGSGYAQLDTENAQPFVRYTFKDTSNNRKLKNGDKMIVLVARLRYAQHLLMNLTRQALHSLSMTATTTLLKRSPRKRNSPYRV